MSSSKSAAAKLRAREEAAFERARTEKRRAAMYTPDGAVRDVLADFTPFAKFERNGVELEVVLTSPEHPAWTAEVAGWVWSLTKANMQALYDATPGFEWKDRAKRAEMVNADMRYLLVRGKGCGPPAAFLSFQFTLEGPLDVLYVWELQLGREVQRKGLGKHLMCIAELIARKQAMHL